MNTIVHRKVRERSRNSGILKHHSKETRDKISSALKRHGMSETRFYNIWLGIKNRCTRPNIPLYSFYGGKGIKCLWGSFLSFKEDMLSSYEEALYVLGEKNTTIDRIDVLGDYEKKNCRWVSRKEQASNRRSTVFVDYDGKRLPMKRVAECMGIPYSTFQHKFYAGNTYIP